MDFGWLFISQFCSPELSEVGESEAPFPLLVCMSSISSFEAARSEALGIMDQIPWTVLTTKMTLDCLLDSGRGNADEGGEGKQLTS